MLENISAILQSPSASFALLGVLLLIFFGLYLRKIKLTTKTLINVSLMLALSALLCQFRIYHFPQGGAVTLGAMLPVILISYRYGTGIGILAGFLLGMINLIQDPFILHPIQVLFDYPLPFMAIGLAGIFREKIFIGAILGFCGRFLCHFISGVVFFSEYAPEGISPVIYSLTANATCIVPEMIICLVLMKVMPVERLLAAMDNKG